METKVIKSTIQSLVDKKWKDKEFVVIVTSEGEISCWTPELSSLLRAAKGSGEEVEIGLTKTAKGNWAVTSVGGTTAAPKGGGARSGAIGAAMERKEAGITKMVERKENSMRQFAILRDSAMFSVETWKQFGGEKETDMLKKAHDYWKEYFETVY